MAHLSSAVEYSLHCLLYLERNETGSAPSTRDLAEFQGISVSFLAKLFTKLQKAGLVTAAEGIHGGFRLARPPAEITVLQVVDAVEGKKSLFNCKNIRANCILYQESGPPPAAVQGLCGIHAIMLEAESAMRRSLAAHSLADIARGVAGKLDKGQRQATTAWFRQRQDRRHPKTKSPASQ